MSHRVEIEDTYAEGFRSIYAEVLITAGSRRWLDHAVSAATGHASSTIMCDCEAGLDHYVGPDSETGEATPDGRPGAVVQFHVPRFRKTRERDLERALLARLTQNVLTCPTATCFNLLDTDPYFKLGRKAAFFGDGFEYIEERFGRKMWVVPTMGGDFAIDRRFGFRNGIMGGNLWFMGETEELAIAATEAGVEAVGRVPGTIAAFPGGIAASASKAGSKYSFLFASTYQQYCPTLKEKLGEESLVPDGVTSIMEIVINGYDLDTVAQATYAAIDATVNCPGLVKISAGNYGGRLGKSFIYLDRDRQSADA